MTRARTIAIAGLTAGLLAGGGVGLTLGVPTIAGAQTTNPAPVTSTIAQADSPSAHADRLREVLQPLVDQGTLTSAQLDAVVTAMEAARPTSSARPGHRGGMKGPSLDTIAALLGSTTEEVAAGLRNGTSIAAQAESAGVPLTTIVDALVAEMSERLTADVASGRLTQEQADAKLTEAPQRITTMLENLPPVGAMRDGGGMGKHRGGRF